MLGNIDRLDNVGRLDNRDAAGVEFHQRNRRRWRAGPVVRRGCTREGGALLVGYFHSVLSRSDDSNNFGRASIRREEWFDIGVRLTLAET